MKGFITGNDFRTRLAFFGAYLKNPAEVASVTPSSRFLIQTILAQIDFSQARCIIEYGAGTGVVTRALLASMLPETRLLVFETNSTFHTHLQETFIAPQVRFIHDSAAQVERHMQEEGFRYADYIISGLPFSTVPKEVCARILDATTTVMHPTSVFITYQLSPFFLPRLLQARSQQVQSRFCPLNIPPLFVHRSQLLAP